MGGSSIDRFCKNHGFSRATYYNLKAVGKGPVEMAIGTRRIISDEAAERWRREREAEAQLAAENPSRPEPVGTSAPRASDDA